MKKLLSFLVLQLSLLSLLNSQQIRYVKPAASGASDGSSWTNASGNLQAVINASSINDQVWVAAGTYLPAAGQTFAMKEGVKIYGGFAGNEASLSGRNLLAGYTSILKGNGNRVIFNLNELTALTLLDGFTITGGKSASNQAGGGIFLNNASPSIANCIFTKDSAGSGGGGAIFLMASTATITNCIFTNNYASGFGGSLHMLSDCDVTVINSRFTGNRSNGTGGAIFNSSGNLGLTIKNSAFISDTARSLGGGIGTQSPVSIINCLFADNRTSDAGGRGPALASVGTITEVTNTTFYGNVAPNSPIGPVIWGQTRLLNGNVSEIWLNNCIIWGNSYGLAGSEARFITRYNIIQQMDNYYPSSPMSTGNLNTNPFFVNPSDPLGPDGVPGTGDDGLRLQSGSPAKNAGNSALLPTGISTDFAGNLRVTGTSIDMGAYEFIDGPLPLRFGDIQARLVHNRLVITWISETETDNDHFDIEIAADGHHFQKLAAISSKAPDGNSSTALHYQYEIDVATAVMLGFGSLGFLGAFFSFGKKRRIRMLTVLAAGLVLYGCVKKEVITETTHTLYIRIVNIDKDGKKIYSKVVQVTKE